MNSYAVAFCMILILPWACTEGGNVSLMKSKPTTTNRNGGGTNTQTAANGSGEVTIVDRAPVYSHQEMLNNISELKLRIDQYFKRNNAVVGQVDEARRNGCFFRLPIQKIEVVVKTTLAKSLSESKEGTWLSVDVGRFVFPRQPAVNGGTITFSKDLAEEGLYTINDMHRLIIQKPVFGAVKQVVIGEEEVCVNEMFGFCKDKDTIQSFKSVEMDGVFLENIAVFVTTKDLRGNVWRRQIIGTTKEEMGDGHVLRNVHNFYGIPALLGDSFYIATFLDDDCEQSHETIPYPDVEDYFKSLVTAGYTSEGNGLCGRSQPCGPMSDVIYYEWPREKQVAAPVFDTDPVVTQAADPNAQVSDPNAQTADPNNQASLTAEREQGNATLVQGPTVIDIGGDSDSNSVDTNADGNSQTDKQVNEPLTSDEKQEQQRERGYVEGSAGASDGGSVSAGKKTKSDTEWQLLKGVYDELRIQNQFLVEELERLTFTGCVYTQKIMKMSIQIDYTMMASFGGEIRETTVSSDGTIANPLSECKFVEDLEGNPISAGNTAFAYEGEGAPRGLRLNLGMTDMYPEVLTADVGSSPTAVFPVNPEYYEGRTVNDIKFLRLTRRGLGSTFRCALATETLKKRKLMSFWKARKENVGADWLIVERNIIRINNIILRINGQILYAAYQLNWVLTNQNLTYSDFSLTLNPAWRRLSGKKTCENLEIQEVSYD